MSNRRQVTAGSSDLMCTCSKLTLLLLFAVTTITCETLQNLIGFGNLQQAIYDSQGRIVYIDYISPPALRRRELNGSTTILAAISLSRYLTEGPSQELYLSYYASHKIVKLDASLTPTDYAGSGTSGHADGTGTSATFTTPMGIIYFALHDALYVAEDGAIRKIIVSTQVVSTVASNATYLADGRHLTMTRNGSYIYAGQYYVTRINVATGAIDKLVSSSGGDIDGNPTTAIIGSVTAYALSLNETRLMIGDSPNNKIRRLNLCSGYVDTAFQAAHVFRGFQQYCFNTSGDCGVVYSTYSLNTFDFYAFEKNTTSTDYSCDIPAVFTLTPQGTPSLVETSTPSESGSPSLSPTANTSSTPSTTVSPSTSMSFNTSQTPTTTVSASWTTTNSTLFTNTKPIDEDADSSWGAASAAVIAVVSVVAVGGMAAVGVAALKAKAAAAAAKAAGSVNAAV